MALTNNRSSINSPAASTSPPRFISILDGCHDSTPSFSFNGETLQGKRIGAGFFCVQWGTGQPVINSVSKMWYQYCDAAVSLDPSDSLTSTLFFCFFSRNGQTIQIMQFSLAMPQTQHWAHSTVHTSGYCHYDSDQYLILYSIFDSQLLILLVYFILSSVQLEDKLYNSILKTLRIRLRWSSVIYRDYLG